MGNCYCTGGPNCCLKSGAPDRADTYVIAAICGNCGERGVYTIPKGRVVKTQKCENCGNLRAYEAGLNYPAAIVTELKAHKLAGLSFPVAWREAMEALGEPPADERGPWAPLLPFIRRNMEKAYAGSRDKPLSRLEPPDTVSDGLSVAYVSPQGHDCVVHNSEVRCRWREGCDQPGGQGKFGHFCAEHVAVIARAMNRPTPDASPQMRDIEKHWERRRAA